MSDLVNLFTTIMESLSLLIWLHIGFLKSLRNSRGKILFIVLYVVYYYIINQFQVSGFVENLPMLLIFIWVVVQFREKIVLSIFKYIISVLGVGLVQVVAFWVIDIIDRRSAWFGLRGVYITVSVLSVILTLCIFYIFRGKKIHISKPDIYSIAVLIYIVGIMIFIKSDYEKHSGIYSYSYVILFFLLVLFVLMIFRGLKVKHKLEQKQQELELREKYGEAYNKLLLEMRRKQHDYKNQISALYSMQLTSENPNDFDKIQSEYAKELLKREKFEELLIGCDNPILSGYVYTFCIEADRLGIRITPRIMCSPKEYNIALHEIIEILGILINNSIEYLNERDWANKEINVEIYENLQKLCIGVSNVAEYKSYEDLERMFQKGFSTKGDDRGIGLYSLKHIVEKNKGKLSVENITKEDINWLKIEAVF